jgi:hypothetical protein
MSTTCEGRWVHVDTIHGNINVLRCSGCADRMIIHGHRRVDVPADVTSRKAIVRWIRAAAC